MKRIEEILKEKSILKIEDTHLLNKELKDYLFKINRVIFKHKKKFGYYENVTQLENELIPIFKEIKVLSLSSNKLNVTKNYLLDCGRDIIKLLRQYHPNLTDIELALNKEIDYNMYLYTQQKKQMNDESLIYIIRNNKRLIELINKYKVNNYKTKNLIQLQEQLKQKIIQNM